MKYNFRFTQKLKRFLAFNTALKQSAVVYNGEAITFSDGAQAVPSPLPLNCSNTPGKLAICWFYFDTPAILIALHLENSANNHLLREPINNNRFS
ncbi:hypothetical protein [Alkalimonas mucilaginosa]|uniref:Uncharacterized protein n=1 Tax=Alkalimonas mucilaginosa TaxID=3057676 RepID=A0ABU7JGJ9_9GAMM|nr:hypothetical protein [Alkalimonas sp. MEB004]MEE2024807.1 hypothetical protein [Alkalimonas sp. MEB004]